VPLAVDSTVPRTGPAQFARVLPASLGVQQAGAGVTPPSSPSLAATTRWSMVSLALVMLGVMVAIGGRIYESHTNMPEYRRLDKRRASAAAEFSLLRRVVFERALLAHEQLYTVIRDLTVGGGVVLVAVMLLRTAESDG